MKISPIASAAPVLVAAVNIMGAVSPAARPIDIIIPVSIAGRADGSITVHIAFHFPAPNPRAASRYELGTLFKASSQERIIVGRISRARVIEPASTLLLSEILRVLIKNASPNRPNTMDGTPASVPTHTRKNDIKELFFAYSAKYIAAIIPSGAAINIAPTVR